MPDPIDAPGLPDLEHDLARLADDAPRRLQDAYVHGGAQIARRARANAPRRTGNLAGSLRSGASSGGGGFARSLVPYAAVQDAGGRGGTGGRIRPTRFMQRAIDDSADEVEVSVDRAIDDAATRQGFK